SVVGSTGPWPINAVLTVNVSGTGDGSVSSSPAGISCGAAGTSCSATFSPGTTVTLTASASDGSEFSGGSGCGGESTCLLTLAESQTVTAQFKAVQQIFYYDLDAIGSVRMVTDAQGSVVERHDYTPFGVEFPGSGAFQPRLVAGQEQDSENVFVYFGGRYLGSQFGRFTTADPIVD